MEQAVAIGTQLVRNGLVHCDLNEFNLMVDLSGGVQSRSHLDNNRTPSCAPSYSGGYGGLSVSGTLRTKTEKDDIGDPYVQHSGSSASVVSRGRGALTVPHGVPVTNASNQHIPVTDGTGEQIAEEPRAEPDAYLPNGIDPKPIVTLIDFPQMISVRHPNAEELWTRDMLCLKRFFTRKLRCELSEERWEDIVPKWEDLIVDLEEEGELVHIEDGDDENDADTVNGGASVVSHSQSVLSVTSTGSIIPKSQLRLDQELLAAGFSKEDAERHQELYYYTTNEHNQIEGVGVPIQEEEDEDDGDDEEEEEELPSGGLILLTNPEDDYDGAITDDEDDDDDNKDKIRVYRERQTSNTQPHHQQQPDTDDRSTTSAFTTMTTAERRSKAEDIARERVKKTLDARKRNKGKKGAYRPRNSNKTYVKGKRVFQDFSAG